MTTPNTQPQAPRHDDGMVDADEVIRNLRQALQEANDRAERLEREKPDEKDKKDMTRWRTLEHGCQHVQFTEINGPTRSFDPRNVTGFDGDLLSMRAVVDDIAKRHLAVLREGITALAALPADREPVAIPKKCWLVRSIGGEGPPMHAFCGSHQEVREALATLMFGDPKDAPQDELDAHMALFTDPDEWGGDGTRWLHRFEVDGVEATFLDEHALLAAPSHPPAEKEQEFPA